MSLPPSLSITPMRQADLSGVWSIEQTLTDPWSYDQLKDELTLRHGWRFVAKDHEDTVVGYLFGSTILDEAEIRKIAVAKSWRRQGIANLLISTAWRELTSPTGTISCFLELRQSNLPALSLYQKNGFQMIGHRKNYYALPMEDAILLKKVINFEKENAI